MKNTYYTQTMEATIKLKVNGKKKPFKVRQTIKSMFIYEQIKGDGKPFNVVTVTDTYLYFYSVVIACNPDSETPSWDEFVESIDSDPSIFETMQNLSKKASDKENMLEVEVKEEGSSELKKK